MAMNTTAILILAAGAAIIGGAIFLKPKEDEDLPPPVEQVRKAFIPVGGIAAPRVLPSQIVQVSGAPHMFSVRAI